LVARLAVFLTADRIPRIVVIVELADRLLGLRVAQGEVEVHRRPEARAESLDTPNLSLPGLERIPVSVAPGFNPARQLGGRLDLLCGFGGVVLAAVHDNGCFRERDQERVRSPHRVLDAILKTVEPR